MEQTQDDLYGAAGEQFAPAIARLARAMERDGDRARDLEQAADDTERTAAESHALRRVRELIRCLAPLDAQVILLWLEGQSGEEIADVTGLSANAAQVRIHRIKALLTGAFDQPAKGGSTA